MRKSFYILDDDKDAIERVEAIFKDFPDYSSVGASARYEEAMNTILKFHPSLIIANIDLSFNGDSVFHFANELFRYKQNVPVFLGMSMYKDKAYDVLKNGFYDLLLKPLREFDIRRSLMRFDKEHNTRGNNTLCMKSYTDYRFVNTDEILYLKADNNATDLFMSDGKTVTGYQGMKYFEEILPENFIRIHHSYIINMDYITRIHFGKSKCTVRNVNAHIPFTKTYKDNVEYLKDVLAKSSILMSP